MLERGVMSLPIFLSTSTQVKHFMRLSMAFPMPLPGLEKPMLIAAQQPILPFWAAQPKTTERLLSSPKPKGRQSRCLLDESEEIFHFVEKITLFSEKHLTGCFFCLTLPRLRERVGNMFWGVHDPQWREGDRLSIVCSIKGVGGESPIPFPFLYCVPVSHFRQSVSTIILTPPKGNKITNNDYYLSK